MSDGLEYYVLDTETTGLKSDYHEIFQISLIKVSNLSQITRNIKVQFPQRASLDSLRITNKSLDDLKKGLSKKQVVEEISNFMELDDKKSDSRCIIAHNVKFDRSFIKSLWKTQNKIFPAFLWMDTLQITRDYIKKNNIVSKANLSDSCDLFGIKKMAGAHDARIDARNTFFLYKKLEEVKELSLIRYIKTEDNF